jgi:hypothetical protein
MPAGCGAATIKSLRMIGAVEANASTNARGSGQYAVGVTLKRRFPHFKITNPQNKIESSPSN